MEIWVILIYLLNMIKLKNLIREIAAESPPAIIQKNPAPAHQNKIVNQKAVNDALLLTITIWKEARSEGERGMHGVLNVIMNRANGDFNKAPQVAVAPKQFSVWNGIPNKPVHVKQLSDKLYYDKTDEG